jgi:hypothetical protein
LVSWPQWRRDNPVGLLSYVQADERYWHPLLPGLPARAHGHGRNRLARAKAIYQAFAAAGVQYADEPLAAAPGAQDIRPPDHVLQAPGRGNCLDLSLAFAGACLNAGLHTLVVACQQRRESPAHVVVVLWLGGDWPGPSGAGGYQPPTPPGQVQDGPLLTVAPRWPGGLRQQLNRPGQFLPVDVTRAATGFHGEDPASFTEAVAAAAGILTDTAGGGGDRWRWEFGVDVGRSWQPGTALAPPDRPAIIPLDPPYLNRSALGHGPLAELKARSGLVPFQPRPELDTLLGWCQADDDPATPPPVRLAIIQGPGGAGKTRLAAELATMLTDRRWYTGFLIRQPPQEAITWLAGVASPLLVVIDYVDARSTQAVSELVQVLTHRRARTVLLFTTRRGGPWWNDLEKRLGQANLTPSRHPDLVLPARHPAPRRVFSKAYRRFTGRPHAAEVDEPALPADGGRWTTLDLVMLAWVRARVGPDLPATPQQLYEKILDRELDHWTETIRARFHVEPTRAALRHAAACISLLAPSHTVLTKVLADPDPEVGIGQQTQLRPGELTDALQRLLPDDEPGVLRLGPDPIAEHLLLATFPPHQRLFRGCLDSLDPDTDPEQARRFCDNLTRAAESTLDGARHQATELAAAALAHQENLWPAALAAALNRGGAFAPALTRLGQREDTPLPLRQVNEWIPYGHTDLRALALTAAERTTPATDEDDQDQDRAAARASAMATLAVRQAEVGRSEAALATARQAEEAWRRLAEANPAAHLPSLAISLSNLGVMLSGLGHREQALAPIEEAVTIRRRLAETNPAAHQPDLAASLNNLGTALAGLGHHERALAPTEEAATIQRRLAETNPAAHLPNLAISLSNLGVMLSGLGHREQALAPIEEAVTIRRRLAETNPAAHQPDLAASLNNLGTALAGLGHHEQALAPTEEAATIQRRLAQANPAAHQPDLAASLNNLGARLAELGHHERALAPTEEAVTIRRRLAETNPTAHQPDLAMSLNNLGAMLAGLGHHEQALAPTEEAATIRRRLAETNPAAHLPDLAASLNNLGARLAELGHHERALAPTEEAVTTYRRLAEINPTAHQPDLAMSLNNLGAMLAGLGHREQALAPTEEAATIRRRLAETNPAAHQPDLAMSLNNLGAALAGLGHHERALAATEEAATIQRRLAEANPAAHQPDLAMSLNNLGNRLYRLGHREQALAPTEEAATIRRRLAEANPAAHQPDLAMSLDNLGAMLAGLGHREQALAPTEEAVTIRRRLAETNPAAHQPDLAMSLNNLGATLAGLGHHERALAPTEEAVTIRRRLAETNPAAHQPDLATSLSNLGALLSELGHRKQALAPTEEAVTIRRRLAQANPAAHQPDLAASLNNLSTALAGLGHHERALAPTEEAITTYRRLAQANPAAYLPNLAMSLNNLGTALAGLGRREQALAATEEAITTYRRLAQANPAAYLPNLAGSLNNLGNRLAELGRAADVVGAIETTLMGLDPGPRAELRLRLARWWANPDEPTGLPVVLEEAITEADTETHPQRGARARRAVRRAATEAGLDTRTGTNPVWVGAATPDEIVKTINRAVAAPSWKDAAAILRSPPADDLFTPVGRLARDALAALHSDQPAVLAVLNVLADIDEHALDPVLDQLCADEQHQNRVMAWVNTPTWTASRSYLLANPDLLTDPRTEPLLTGSGDAVARRHLAIARLARHLPLEEVYDLVVDPTDAVDAALTALDRADLGQLTEIWHAAAHLARQPFVAAYLAAILIVGSDQPEHHDQARQLIARAITDRTAIERTDELAWLRRFTASAPARLDRLAEHYPDHAGILHELAALLAVPEPAA